MGPDLPPGRPKRCPVIDEEDDEGDPPGPLDDEIQDAPPKRAPDPLDAQEAAKVRAARMNQIDGAIRRGDQPLTVIERAAAAQYGIPRADVRALIDAVIEELPPDVAVKLQKRPSGQDFARRRKAQEVERHLAALKKLGYEVPSPAEVAPDLDDSAGDFAGLPDPAEADPSTAMTITRQYQARALQIAATKPLTPTRLKRLGLVKDFGATIGMTQQRSDLEEIAERCEALLTGARPRGAVRIEPVPPGEELPPGSRGAKRKPRAVPPPDDAKH